MPSKMTMEDPAAMELTKKNMGMKGEYHKGCSFSGAMRYSAPSEDWCRVDSVTPKMVSTMVACRTTLRHLRRKVNLDDSHSIGATENSMSSTVT